MSDLHAKIMNLECNEPDLNRTSVAPAYRLGHRDARHAAAELAAAHQARIEALTAALAKADELWGVIDTPDQSDGREGNYHYDWQRVDNALTAYRQARDATT